MLSISFVRMIMKPAGIIKEFDKLGRIVIPKDMQDLFRLNSAVEIVITSEGILLRNPKFVLTEINKTKREN